MLVGRHPGSLEVYLAGKASSEEVVSVLLGLHLVSDLSDALYLSEIPWRERALEMG
jgi:hypothetical protein